MNEVRGVGDNFKLWILFGSAARLVHVIWYISILEEASP
jgi:hypothetical protein